jgi:hypothetical protein
MSWGCLNSYPRMVALSPWNLLPQWVSFSNTYFANTLATDTFRESQVEQMAWHMQQSVHLVKENSHKPSQTILLMLSFFRKFCMNLPGTEWIKHPPIGASWMGLHLHVLLLHFTLTARIGFSMSGAMPLKWGHPWLQGPLI